MFRNNVSSCLFFFFFSLKNSIFLFSFLLNISVQFFSPPSLFLSLLRILRYSFSVSLARDFIIFKRARAHPLTCFSHCRDLESRVKRDSANETRRDNEIISILLVTQSEIERVGVGVSIVEIHSQSDSRRVLRAASR